MNKVTQSDLIPSLSVFGNTTFTFMLKLWFKLSLSHAVLFGKYLLTIWAHCPHQIHILYCALSLVKSIQCQFQSKWHPGNYTLPKVSDGTSTYSDPNDSLPILIGNQLDVNPSIQSIMQLMQRWDSLVLFSQFRFFLQLVALFYSPLLWLIKNYFEIYS